MKKIIAASVHAFAILLLLISVSILNISSSGSSLLSIIQQPKYLGSAAFEGEVASSVNDIFDYIDLRDLFEKKGTLNLNQVIAQADENGTTVSYTLNYLIKYARSMGYYLDAKNEIQSDGAQTMTKQEDERDHQIRVTFRAYMPEYKPASPADGMTTVGKLAQEMLTYLAKYYTVRGEFFDQESNLKFLVRYEADGNFMEYTNASGMSSEEIKELGSYICTDSESLAVQSNMKAPPSNIIPMVQARNPYSDGKYTMSVGVDTSFPAQDRFAEAAHEYDSRRTMSIVGLTLLLFSILLAGISFGILIQFTGRVDGVKSLVLYPMDKLPLEILLLFFIIWNLLVNRITPIFLDSLTLVMGQITEGSLFSEIIAFTFKYILFVPLSLCIIRNYKAESLWKNSLLKKLVDIIRYYAEAVEQTAPRFFSAALFFIPNIVGLILFVSLFIRFIENRSLAAFFYAIGLLLVVAAIDFYSWRITTGLNEAVSKQVKSERLRTDLITNVSHDLKTPLTSIINYVDLLKREEIDNPRVQDYLTVLEQKSNRLKALTEDLVEASKASSGNVTMDFMEMNYGEMVQQALGEFEDKLSAAKLTIVENIPQEPIMILSDGRHLWRVIENLLNNCCKYALRGSRVYVDVYTEGEWAICTIKNISEAELNISPDELTERFVRGDVSRSTEGSGLGLSIAKSLTKLMKGELRIEIDGDLYKASVCLPLLQSSS